MNTQAEEQHTTHIKDIEARLRVIEQELMALDIKDPMTTHEETISIPERYIPHTEFLATMHRLRKEAYCARWLYVNAGRCEFNQCITHDMMNIQIECVIEGSSSDDVKYQIFPSSTICTIHSLKSNSIRKKQELNEFLLNTIPIDKDYFIQKCIYMIKQRDRLILQLAQSRIVLARTQQETSNQYYSQYQLLTQSNSSDIDDDDVEYNATVICR